MLFSSVTFLCYFLPFVLIGSLIIQTNKWRNLFLLLSSILFFLWGEAELIFLLLLCVFINYIFAVFIDWQQNQSKRKALLIVVLVFNIGLLAYYKYYNFFITNVNDILGTAITQRNILLPLGISFYTFHNISYVIDVYKRKVAAQKDIVNLALYIVFFPQLIAGPIVRYVDVADQLYNRIITSEKFTYGIKRFIGGLGKKVLIANTFALIADQIYALPTSELTWATSWVGAIAFALQVYFDFSGYSDMAIGLGRMFGFTFLENFDFPYISNSVQEFWRKWHISLSTWFRDYLYFPLGGSKVKPWRVYFNLSVVFLCTGFWHGASWNFIVWGGIHGLLLMIERLGLSNLLSRIPGFFSNAYVIIALCFSWPFFCIENLSRAIDYCAVMAGIKHFPDACFELSRYADMHTYLIFPFAILLTHPLTRLKKWFDGVIANTNTASKTLLHGGVNLGYLLILFLSVVSVTSGTYNPFIYFRF